MNRNKVEDVLFTMGIPASVKGFKYIVDALEVIDQYGCTVGITKVLYPEVAKINCTTASRAERDIRHALCIANSDRGDYEIFEKYIGHINTTNRTALASLYKHIKADEEEREVATKHVSEISPELESAIRRILREELKRTIQR